MEAEAKAAEEPGQEVNLNWSLIMYEKTLHAVYDDSEEATSLAMLFVNLPCEAFISEPFVTLELTPIQKMALSDIQIYHMFLCELYHKLNILLTYFSFEDDGIYASVKEALVRSVEIVHERYAEEFPGGVAKYDRLVSEFFQATSLLTSTHALPQQSPEEPFMGVGRALDFMLISSDMLFGLCCYADPTRYLNSGYVPANRKYDPEVRTATRLLLEYFYASIQKCYDRSC